MPIPSSGEIRFSAIATEFQDDNPIRLSDYFKDNSTINTGHISSFPDTGNEFRLTLFRGKQRNGDVIDTTTLYNDLNSLRTKLLTYSSVRVVDDIRTLLESYGYRLVATPIYDAMAEKLTYQENNITELGRFNVTYFNSTDALKLSNGFEDNTLNNHPYMCIAIFDYSNFVGIATMLFRNWKDDETKRLRDFFYGTSPHNLYGYILNADGSEDFDVGGSTKWIFSDNQRAGENGYYQINKFSADDGIWGFSKGNSVNGNSGPGLRSYSSGSYGIENYNSTDNPGYFMWNGVKSSTGYVGYVFVRTDDYY